MSLGGRHAACLTNDGECYTWGEGAKGQCGHGVTEVVTMEKSNVSCGLIVILGVCGGTQACLSSPSTQMHTSRVWI